MDQNTITISIPFNLLISATFLTFSIHFFVKIIKRYFIKEIYLNAPNTIPTDFKINPTEKGARDLIEKEMKRGIWELYKRYLWSKQFTLK